MGSDWIDIIVGAVCSLIAAFGGGGIIYYRQTKKMKDIEVVHTQADEWKRLYEESEDERKTLSNKIDELYKEQHELRRKMLMLEVEVKRLLPYTCTRIDCNQRQQCTLTDDE